jgi:outer membrane protein assembly factor BamD (BamD/ComL family)
MRARALFVAALILTAAVPASPQSSDEQARRLLEDGKDYFSKGRYKQALDNFNTIVSGFSQTDSVDDALLEIGRYYLEVDGNAAKARESFEQVAQRYPQSDGAPGAYYYLGWLTMGRASTAAELDDAMAQFDRIRTLYPRSDWVPRAFYATGLVHRKAGRLAQAVDSERRAALEYPTSETAPVAQFQIGHCLALMGEPRLAMEEYQRVRNRFPESEWSERALDRITALYRLHAGAAPSFAVDTAYVINGGDILKDVRAILMDRGRTLWIASEKAKSAVPFDTSGKMGPSLAIEEVRSLALSPKGELITVGKLAVRFGMKDIKSFAIPTEKGVPEQLEKITSAVVTQGGSILVADEKKHRVYRYDAQFQYKGLFPDTKEHTIVRMTLDGEGGIVLLDSEERSVRVYDEAGKLMRSVGGKGATPELRHPVDVAVDASLNSYVVDEEAGVYVFSPAGKLLATLSGDAVRKPKAVSLDASGSVLVYDDKTQRVVRFK